MGLAAPGVNVIDGYIGMFQLHVCTMINLRAEKTWRPFILLNAAATCKNVGDRTSSGVRKPRAVCRLLI